TRSAWCWTAATLPPRRPTRVRTACRRSARCWAMPTWRRWCRMCGPAGAMARARSPRSTSSTCAAPRRWTRAGPPWAEPRPMAGLFAALQDRHGLAFHELAQGVDAAQLQDGIAHGRLDQHGEIAAGRDLQHHLAHRQAEHVLGDVLQGQALEFVLRGGAH